MRLLIIGSMNGQIGAASKIAIDHGASVSHVQNPSAALELARAGQSADLVMIDAELDIAAFVKSLKDDNSLFVGISFQYVDVRLITNNRIGRLQQGIQDFSVLLFL